jgi:hypothetical protein
MFTCYVQSLPQPVHGFFLGKHGISKQSAVGQNQAHNLWFEILSSTEANGLTIPLRKEI